MQGTDEVNPRAVVTSRRIATAPSIVSVGKTLPLRHHHVNLGLRLAQGQGASSTDASGMRECPDLNALCQSSVRSGYQSAPRVVAQEAAGYQQRGP